MLGEELGLVAGLDYRRMTVASGNTATPDELQPFDAVLCLNTKITAQSLVGVDRLSIVARWGIGCDNLDVEALSLAGAAVTTTAEAARRPTAESIFTLILSLAKNLAQQDRLVRSAGWRDHARKPAMDLRGRVLGSIGCGQVGREMFQVAQAFGFRCLLAYDPYRSQSEVVDLGVELVDLDTLCRESDFLTINAPLTEETNAMVGWRQFRLMRPTSYLVNTARPQIVSHEALAAAVTDGRIAGAALDASMGDRLPPDDPLQACENVILAPQSLAWTHDMLAGAGKEACGHILSVGRGEIPAALVNRCIVES
ncbi:MAG: NAD(P)-dependent oxidoreductase [Bryobacteraceae bacterium]